jgi:hypothetical protein
MRRRLLVPVALLAASAITASPVAAAGKPGYPDRVTWSGASWQVKTSRSAVGPGPNIYDKSNVWVDAACAEIIGSTSFGYGAYTFTLASRVDQLDPNVVLGLFTWSDKAAYAHREVDIEFARWGNSADPTNAQYVVQPHATAGHLNRFTQGASVPSTHSFTWRAGWIDWVSRDAAGAITSQWTYTGSDVPKPGDERVRLNLWLFGGSAPTTGQPAEVVVRSFAFTP